MPDQLKMATIVTALLLIPSAYAATAAANHTENMAAWTPEPRARGTWSIICNCIFTLVICIWTAIHDDVKIERLEGWEKKAIRITPFSRLLSKLQWMLYAFVAPENVIISAYSQWKEARKLQKEFCSLGGKRPGGKDDILGLEGSFFVIMGGFSSGPIEVDGTGYLDAEDFISLIKDRGVPDSVNLRVIQDRGKADAIGKILAVIQAVSLLIQCLLRKIHGLPVTLLEFHVVIHVFCAIIIYGFWWSKPQNFTEPIPIEQPATKFAQLPPLGGVGGEGTPSDNQNVESFSLASRTAACSKVADIEQAPNSTPVLRAGALAPCATPMDTTTVFQRPPNLSLFTWGTIMEIFSRLKRWYKKDLVDKFIGLHLMNTIPSDPSKNIVIISMYTVYGAVHSIAWNSSFPTPTEQLLWRITCISLIVTPLFLYALNFTIHHSTLGRLWTTLFNFMLLLAIILIFICRSYLTIECFISLRFLPAGAYEIVTWETIWPHL
ncbi:hypothetical protein DFP73DRAFT_361023 [Morchella snyderi]|nr:hypothetical protein DFP73DRAFT_361023 [Morchella snyderi]